MPIKFRCPHCQQFLGISRSRAGAVTDCPMCGRGIRVPQLDGSVEPLPEPELNLGDHGLASALDKLAGLVASERGSDSVEGVAPTNPRAAVVPATAGPVALPEPIELQPAPAPVVVVAVPAGPTISATATAPKAVATENVLASLAESPAVKSFDRSRRSDGERGGWLTLALGAFVAATACFGLGFTLGRASKPEPGAASAPAAAAPAAPAAPVAPAPAAETAVTGRVSYVGADGEVRPDAGARILMLPEERQGTAKLASDGFRAGANEADLKLGVASLRALGGDFAIATADGSYSITLPQAGVYQLLILSRYQARVEGSPPDAAAMQLLTAYFDRPPQVAGEAALHIRPFRYRGSGTTTLDQTFERP
jgi:hypothetical protein